MSASRRLRHEILEDDADGVVALPEQIANSPGCSRVLIGFLNVTPGQTYSGVLTDSMVSICNIWSCSEKFSTLEMHSRSMHKAYFASMFHGL